MYELGMKMQSYHMKLIEHKLSLQRLHCHVERKHKVPGRNSAKQFAWPRE